jgi:dipeptidase D
MQEFFVDQEGVSLHTTVSHAAVECGILAKKYPQTNWVSVGATINNMHTTQESIQIQDFQKFVERMEQILLKT